MDPPELVRPAPADALRLRRRPEEIVLIVNDLLARVEAAGLCERARSLLAQRDDVPVYCDVGRIALVDAATVDALARLQLTARRCGCGFKLRHAARELQELIAYMGLAEALPVAVG